MYLSMYQSFSILVSLAMLIGVISIRNFNIQVNIAVVTISTMAIVLLKFLSFFQIIQPAYIVIDEFMRTIDYHSILMDGLLSFLLFAGALSINFNQIKDWALEIGILALISTCISTVLIAYSTYYTFHWIGIDIPLIYCLLYGSLISPTDPIAVIAMLKELKAPSSLQTKIAGESLFNDGVGIVLFAVLYDLLNSPSHSINMYSFLYLFSYKSILGMFYGYCLGVLLKHLIDYRKGSYVTDVMSTLVVTTGAYTVAELLHISGPLAMVVAGLSLSQTLNSNNVSPLRRKELHHFWVMIDEVFNVTLFMLLGLEAITIPFVENTLIVMATSIVICLIVRYIAVAIPMSLLKMRRKQHKNSTMIIVWGGLRGGLAMALALSIPYSEFRDVILTATFSVIMFSIVIQGTTIKHLVKQ
jgi:monovalent cation:H+ antiporter, CPA1 family